MEVSRPTYLHSEEKSTSWFRFNFLA